MNRDSHQTHIKKIHSLTQDVLEKIAPGYSSGKVFRIKKIENENQITFTLNLEKLDRPFLKRHNYADPSILDHYNSLARQGHSYGAFSKSQCVGFILTEVQKWNSTLIVREFGVHPEMRRQGTGKALVNQAIEEAKAQALTSIFCETQNTNVGAIEFYKSLGFVIDGLDLFFYGLNNASSEEVAIFLRKPL